MYLCIKPYKHITPCQVCIRHSPMCMCISQSSAYGVSPFSQWMVCWDCSKHLISWALSFLPSCGEPQSDFICVVRSALSDIWINKDSQAQASRPGGAAVNTCLSDYWRASCLPQSVLPAPWICVILPGSVLIALYKQSSSQTLQISKCNGELGFLGIRPSVLM